MISFVSGTKAQRIEAKNSFSSRNGVNKHNSSQVSQGRSELQGRQCFQQRHLALQASAVFLYVYYYIIYLFVCSEWIKSFPSLWKCWPSFFPSNNPGDFRCLLSGLFLIQWFVLLLYAQGIYMPFMHITIAHVFMKDSFGPNHVLNRFSLQFTFYTLRCFLYRRSFILFPLCALQLFSQFIYNKEFCFIVVVVLS